MSQVVESLPSKYKVLSSNPCTGKKKKSSICTLTPAPIQEGFLQLLRSLLDIVTTGIVSCNSTFCPVIYDSFFMFSTRLLKSGRFHVFCSMTTEAQDGRRGVDEEGMKKKSESRRIICSG
jgi:hypothetical protein